jgi:flavin reductase (DIM6/NTAB) family NADH-FMN oxidoreductase RutF
MGMIELPIQKAFTLIEPGPVILVTTNDGIKNNIMTISWHMVNEFTPRIALTTGSWNHSFETMMKTKECVICVPGVDLAEKTVRIGTVSGAEVDKFKEFGLTPLPAATVSAPLIAECTGCIECVVLDYIEAYDILILEGRKAWKDEGREERRTFHAVGDGTFTADGETLDYRSLMENKLPDGV